MGNSVSRLRKKYDYYKEFDVLINSGFYGHEVAFKDTVFGRTEEEIPKIKELFDQFSTMNFLNQDNEKEIKRIRLYKQIYELIENINKKCFFPSKEFDSYWTKRELEIYKEIVVPSVDFIIKDTYETNIADSIADGVAIKYRIPIVMIDKNESIMDSLVKEGIGQRFNPRLRFNERSCRINFYPIISENHDDILEKMDEFLRKFYEI